MIVLTALILTAPPLAPGVHRCGTQWDSYGELCTVTETAAGYTIESVGPAAKLSGTMTLVDDHSFDLKGEVKLLGVPIGYTDLSICDAPGTFRFRQSGKRKYFRYTLTCKDMGTSYFDIFIDTVDASKIEMTKKLSAMTGSYFYDTRETNCYMLNAETLANLKDTTCQRWGDTGYNSPYYDCPIVGAEGHVYVFPKKKACTDIANKLNNVRE